VAVRPPTATVTRQFHVVGDPQRDLYNVMKAHLDCLREQKNECVEKIREMTGEVSVLHGQDRACTEQMQECAAKMEAMARECTARRARLTQLAEAIDALYVKYDALGKSTSDFEIMVATMATLLETQTRTAMAVAAANALATAATAK
jgi:SMC interacting uncharacterized protein involved in chromosome segregation